MDMNEVSQYIQATRGVLEILKSAGGMLPKGPNAEEAQRQLEQAERALRASEAQLAKALGYRLCQCTFPPQIMLRDRAHPQRGMPISKCPQCGAEEPSAHDFRQMDKNDEAVHRARTQRI